MFDLQLCQSSKHIKECNLFCSFAMTKLIYSSQFLKLWLNILKIYIQIHKKKTKNKKNALYINAKLQTGVKNVKHYYLMSFTYRSLS